MWLGFVNTIVCCGVSIITAKSVNTMFDSPAGGFKAILSEVDSLLLLLFSFFSPTSLFFIPDSSLAASCLQLSTKNLRRLKGNALFSSPIFHCILTEKHNKTLFF